MPDIRNSAPALRRAARGIIAASAAAAQRTGTADAASNGRRLYITRCTECHSAPAPASLSLEEWGRILPQMADLAALNDAERAAVRAYVEAVIAAVPRP
jgi:mono/diheme cytochrome c family protein